jgi:hypothetical protein
MSGRLNWDRSRSRARVGRQGIDDITDTGRPASLSAPKPKPSKATMRTEAEAAIAAATRTISCLCGHRVAIPITAKMKGKSFKCSQCDRRIAQ